MVMLLGGGLQWSNPYWIGKDKSNLNVIFSNSLFFAGIVGILLFITYYSGGYEIAKHYTTKPLIIVILVAVPFLLIQQYNQAILQGLQNFNGFNIINVIRVTSLLIAYTVLLVCLRLDVQWAAIGWIVTILLVSIVSVYFVVKEVKNFKIVLDPKQIYSSLKVGGRATLANFSWILLSRSDIYLIGYFCGTADVGYYAIAALVAETLVITPQIVGLLIFPKASAQEKDSHLLIAKLNRITIVYSVIMATLLIFFGKPIIILLMGSDFAKSFYALLILLPGIIAVNSGSNIGSFIGGREGYPSILILSTVMALVINVSLNMILIPKIGILGAAISTSIGYSTSILLYCKYFKELTALPFREFLLPQWKDLIYFKTQAGKWIK